MSTNFDCNLFGYENGSEYTLLITSYAHDRPHKTGRVRNLLMKSFNFKLVFTNI